MAEVLPFKGIYYNPEKIHNLSLVVSPPYDVISDEERENYYNQHLNNVIRLIFGKDISGDTDQENKYTRAGKYFQEWLNQHILVQDEQPAFYVYQQDYQLPYEGKMRSLTGFIARVSIYGPEEIQKILPHERTLPATVADRLNLIKACQANLCPVFALYSDSKNQIQELLISETLSQPFLRILDVEGIQHQIWKVQDPEKIQAIQSEMKDKVLVIADGHHRYEAARQFRDYRHALDPDPSKFKAYNYLMMRLAALETEGLTVFPIHRLVQPVYNFNLEQFLKKLRQFFHLESFKLDEKEKDDKLNIIINQLKTYPGIAHQFIMYTGQNIGYRLTLKNLKDYERVVDPTLPEVLKDLDVSVLHNLILDQVLEGKEKKLEIYYLKDGKKALELVNIGRYRLAFFLNPTRISQVVEVAALGRCMPPKSTYFYPKPLTGLIMNKI